MVAFSMLVILSTLTTVGISTGSFELRADGTFREWTIFNQHPAGAVKIQVIDDEFLSKDSHGWLQCGGGDADTPQ